MPANIAQKVTGLITNQKVNFAQRKIEGVRSNILMIAKRGNGITTKEFNSIKGDMQFIHSISEEKAERLKEFVNLMLPKTFIQEVEREKPIIRKCRHHKQNN